MKKWLYILLLPAIVFAAQRKVMIEVFTETTCPYCPYSSYGLDTLEMNVGDSIVVLKNHPSSSDPFYTPEAVSRAYYYPDFSGYPTAYFDGVIKVEGGWNGVYQSYYNAYISRIDSTSPITLSITLNYNPAQKKGSAIIETHAESKIPEHTYLRTAIVEDSIHYHWESRDILRYVLRGMYPDAQGTPLSLNAGETFIDTVNFTTGSSWLEPNLYFITFVQNDDSKEVFQAEWKRFEVNYGDLKVLNFSYSDSIGNNNGRLEPDDSAVFNIGIYNHPPYNTADYVCISLWTDDSTLIFSDTSFYFDSIGTHDTVYISSIGRALSSSPHSSNIYLRMVSDSGSFDKTDTFTIKIGIDSLLVYDATDNRNIRNYVLPYLDTLNVSYDFQSKIDSGKPIIYPDYKYIFYYTGSQIPDSQDIEFLENSMNNGKNMFISGQNIAKTQDSLFLTDYLKVKFLYDTTLDLLARGAGFIFNPEDTIFLTGQGSAMNQYSKDVIEPLSGATPILYYRKYRDTTDLDTVAAVAYDDGTKRVVFFAFGYEGTGELRIGKKEILRRVLNYLGYNISGIAEKTALSTKSSGAIILHSSTLRIQGVKEHDRYTVYNAAGIRKYQGYIKDGRIKFPEDLKDGIYFVKLSGNNNEIKRVVLLR